MVTLLRLVTAGIVAGVAACGGTNKDESASCQWGGACGGDLAGAWTFTSECVFGTFADAACPGHQLSQTQSVSGSVTFAADGTMTGSRSEDVTAEESVPGSCVSNAGASDCNALADAFRAQLPPGSSVTCTGDISSACSCSEKATFPYAMGGSYGVTSTSVTLDYATGSVATYDYCVRGNTLALQHDNADGTQTVIIATRAAK